MKRKLNENDLPASESEPQIDKSGDTEVATTATTSPEPTFTDLGLDPRLVQAIAKQKFHCLTSVQRAAIPAALSGQDVLARAKTGSGKTLCYILPLLQNIIKKKQQQAGSGTSRAATTGLILVPTRELADQVFKAIGNFSAFCSKDVQAVKITDSTNEAVLRSLLSDSPDIVIATPAKAWNNISLLGADKLTFLVLDEADLLFSYGYQDDLENLAQALPKGIQTIMTSATLTNDVDDLKGLFCRNPVLLDLEETETSDDGVQQYYVK